MSRKILGAMVRVKPAEAMSRIGEAIAATGSASLAAGILGVRPRTLRDYVAALGRKEVYEIALERMRQ
jgi:hypothetical protein